MILIFIYTNCGILLKYNHRKNIEKRRLALRSMIRKLSLLAAALMIMAVPVLAEEGAGKTYLDESQRYEKNECLLEKSDRFAIRGTSHGFCSGLAQIANRL